MVLMLNVGLLVVEEIDLVLPLTALDGADVAHAGVLLVIEVCLLDDVRGRRIVRKPTATFLELPVVIVAGGRQLGLGRLRRRGRR